MFSLSRIGTGFPRAPASGCPSEVVRDQTRDKLGKDKEEIPRPLYLFVRLSAIFAYVVVYKVLHSIWSYWIGSSGEIFKGVGALMHPSPDAGQGLVPVCAFISLWLQPCSYLDPQELVQGPGGWLCSPQPLSQPVRAVLVPHLELSPDITPQSTSTGWGGGGSASLESSAPREGLAPAGTPALTQLRYPTVSDAFLLKAETLSSEQSLCHGDCSIFSGFFSNPLDQREKNQSWLVMSAVSLLQQPASWSKGQHWASAERSVQSYQPRLRSSCLLPATSPSSGLH